MEEKKPSTAEILAKIRAQKAAAAAQTPESPASSESPSVAPTAEPVAAAPAESPAPASPVEPPKPAAPAGAKPTSTKDIMAAIRAGGAKPAAAASKAAPAATPAAPSAPPTPAAAAGPKLTTQEMLKKIREASAPGGSAAAAPAPVVKGPVTAPPIPPKPVAAGKSAKPTAAQRGMASLSVVMSISAFCLVFGYLAGSYLLTSIGVLIWVALMSPFSAAWAAMAGIGGIWTLGTARFMFPNVLVEPPSKFKVGPLSDYPLNTVSNKWKDQFGIWIVHTDQLEGRNLIFALASVCTHLGCTPNWLDGEQKFKCPCHGSGFYITGINFEGPAPRPLERMGLRVAEDGMLEVNKSVKFQEEMGQWADSTSYVEVV